MAVSGARTLAKPLRASTPGPDEAIVKALRRIVRGEPNIAAAYLFGSYARGRVTPMSDLDVAVLLAEPASARQAVEYQLDLMGRLDDTLHLNAEVVIVNFASPLLAHEVVPAGILFYVRDHSARLVFESRARRMYFDLLPTLEAHTQDVMNGIVKSGLGARRRRRQGSVAAGGRLLPRRD